MNCMLETVASIFLKVRHHFAPLDSAEHELALAEDNLESCRTTLCIKEQELSRVCVQLGKEALHRRSVHDIEGAKQKLRDRKRQGARLDKLRHSIMLVDRQLDALRSRELDVEIMESLKLSNKVMKKAGIRAGVDDVEKVMNELDKQIRQSEELSTALAAPVSEDFMAMQSSEADLLELDEELGLLAEEFPSQQQQPPMHGSSSAAGHEIGEAASSGSAANNPQEPQTRAHHRRWQSEDYDNSISAADRARGLAA